jgi:hypothetical protein
VGLWAFACRHTLSADADADAAVVRLTGYAALYPRLTNPDLENQISAPTERGKGGAADVAGLAGDSSV